MVASPQTTERSRRDFWRLIWEQDCRQIIMLVDRNERQRAEEGARYWPKVIGTTESWGVLQVSLADEARLEREQLICRRLLLHHQGWYVG